MFSKGKYVVFAVVMLSLLLVLAGCHGDETGEDVVVDDAEGAEDDVSPGEDAGDAEEVLIGTVGPLSGGAATYGVSVKQGVEIAVEEFNAAGGAYSIKLISEDSKGEATDAALAITKLIEQDRVAAIVGAVLSSETLAGTAIANDAGVTMISPSSTATGIPQEGEYIFRNCLSDDVQASQLAEYAYEELGISTFAVMYTNNDYGQALQKAFIETAEELGEVVEVQTFMDKDTDFSAALTSINQKDPGAIFVAGYYEEAAKIAQQAREQGIEAQILGADGFYSPILLELGAESVEGAIFTAGFYEGDATPEVVNFVTKYREKFGDTPDMFAAQAYDAAKVVLNAITKGGADPAAIRDVVAATVDFPGITGNTSFDEDGDVLKDILILKVEGGYFTRIR